MTTENIQSLIAVLLPLSLVASKFPDEQCRVPHLYVVEGTSGFSFSYTTILPPLVSCLSNQGSCCEISTNIPVATLNSTYRNSFPPSNDTDPLAPNYTRYITPFNMIYK